MSNKHSKILSIVLVVLFVFQCLPVNALQVFAESVAGSVSEVTDSGQAIPISTSEGSYEAVKPNYDTDSTIESASVAIIPSSNKLTAEGRTTFKNGGQVALSIVDLSGQVLGIYIAESKEGGSFKLNAPLPQLTPDKYVIHIKGKEINTVKKNNEDGETVTVNVSEAVPSSENTLLSTTDTNITEAVSQIEDTQVSAYSTLSYNSSIEAGVPQLLDAVSDEFISSLVPNANIKTKTNVSNLSSSSVTVILYHDLYNKFDEKVDYDYTIQNVPAYGNVDIETDALTLPGDVDGMYTKAYLVDLNLAPLTPELYCLYLCLKTWTAK